jgi:hypothetical protein
MADSKTLTKSAVMGIRVDMPDGYKDDEMIGIEVRSCLGGLRFAPESSHDLSRCKFKSDFWSII